MVKQLTIQDILTPALLVDLDIMEANLAKMASFFTDTTCKLRPHFKNHKCIALAKKQLEAGAIGITTATLHETEVLVNAGISSILIANEITGESNLKKLIELASEIEIIAAVDNAKIVNDIARLSAGKQTKLSLVVDVDLGLQRCGVPTIDKAIALARLIKEKGLTFDGLMGYEGHLQRLAPGNESEVVRKSAMHKLVAIKNELEGQGIKVNIVSAGGTGTYSIAGNVAGITEIQAGNYLLMDTSYAPFAPDFTPALSLLTNIISITPGDRLIINSGIKAISGERGLPAVKYIEGAILKALHAEHGIVETRGATLNLQAGDAVELSVYYSDGTVNLHSKMYGVRNGVVEQIFEIAKTK